MKFSVTAPDFDKLVDGVEGDIAGAATRAMKRAVTELKDELRGQVTGAGMGRRLANTWRGEKFPKVGRSMNPAGYVWSQAPDIINSYTAGTTLRPHGGKNFLWIPTRHVPRKFRGKKRMTPDEVEVHFNQDLVVRKGNGRNRLAFVFVVAARSRRGGFRQATRRRVAQGRAPRLQLMFVLVPSVTKPKLFDLQDSADRAANRFTTYLAEELRKP